MINIYDYYLSRLMNDPVRLQLQFVKTAAEREGEVSCPQLTNN